MIAGFVEFAAYQFELAALEDGIPVIEHLLAAERATGRTPQALLDAPLCPEGCAYLWFIFNELHACRRSDIAGPIRITYVDLDAYQRVTGRKLQPWELEAIRRADAAFLDNWSDRQPKG